jgi:hypothetical protein
MKVVVIGGTGILGSNVVQRLKDHGDEAVAASPRTGVNTLTGEGLADVLTNANVVVGWPTPACPWTPSGRSPATARSQRPCIIWTLTGSPSQTPARSLRNTSGPNEPNLRVA